MHPPSARPLPPCRLPRRWRLQQFFCSLLVWKSCFTILKILCSREKRRLLDDVAVVSWTPKTYFQRGQNCKKDLCVCFVGCFTENSFLQLWSTKFQSFEDPERVVFIRYNFYWSWDCKAVLLWFEKNNTKCVRVFSCPQKKVCALGISYSSTVLTRSKKNSQMSRWSPLVIILRRQGRLVIAHQVARHNVLPEIRQKSDVNLICRPVVDIFDASFVARNRRQILIWGDGDKGNIDYHSSSSSSHVIELYLSHAVKSCNDALCPSVDALAFV